MAKVGISYSFTHSARIIPIVIGKAVQRCHECHIATYSDTITVYNCSGLFQSSGIEMVARSSILNATKKLYVSQGIDSVTLGVEGYGMYEVTIWPIGAFDRMCAEQVMVLNTNNMLTEKPGTTELPTNNTESSYYYYWFLLGGIILLPIMLCIIVARRCPMKRRKGESKCYHNHSQGDVQQLQGTSLNNKLCIP